MPNLQHFITLPLFITLFTCLILSTEGRPLNGLTINFTKRNSLILRKLGSFLGKTTSPITKSYSKTHSESANMNQYLKPETSDDYRPTTPGKSPGAGHPEEQDSVNSKVAAPGMVFENDFRPTSPGSSPGAGHSETHSDNEQVTAPTRFCVDGKCVDDFRPTAPGDSPGAGHSFTESAKPNQAIPMEQRKVKN